MRTRVEICSLRGRFGLFDMAIQWCVGPRNMQIFSHEVSKFTHMFGVFHDAAYLGHYALDSENILIYI